MYGFPALSSPSARDARANARGLVVVRLGLSVYVDAWNHADFLADLLGAL